MHAESLSSPAYSLASILKTRQMLLHASCESQLGRRAWLAEAYAASDVLRRPHFDPESTEEDRVAYAKKNGGYKDNGVRHTLILGLIKGGNES